LIVLPSHELTGVPVEVLLEAWKDAPSPVVSYAPSGTVFARLARAGPHRPDAKKMLAVGDPVYDQTSSANISEPRPVRGVFVMNVYYPNDWHGGIENGDVITSYDGHDVVDPAQFKQLLEETRARRRSRRPPEPFRPMVTVWRDGGTFSLVLDPHFTSIKYQRPTDPPARLPTRASRSIPGSPLLAPVRRPQQGPRVIALEVPSWSRLPGTRLEVSAIGELFPAADVTMLVGESATERQIQRLTTSGELARYRFLHFATHGTADPDVPMSSALILGPETDQLANWKVSPWDDRITAEQILNTWNLDAEMVVFSACQSGLGKKVRGEGYLGFAQALFIKGAHSLVLSQWSVSDASTALLMERFYQNLLGKRPELAQPLAKAEALDEAKRWLRNLTKEEVISELGAIQKRGTVRPIGTPSTSAAQASPPPASTGPRPFEHPQFWAAFILIGGPN
jgi:hypothetical protein